MFLGKLAVSGGMSIFALLFYRSMFGAVFTLPFAMYFEGGKWKEVNAKTVGWLFLNALSGYSLPMAFYYYGLRDTAASYAVIFSSITPLVTFILSILIGIEQLNIKSKGGSAKVLGALFCFTGALVISLYTGKELHRGSPVINVTHSNGAAGGNHLRGTLLLLSFGLSYATWYPIQVKVLKVCPSKHWSSVLTCILGGVQPLVIGIVLTREKSAWQMKWNIQLLTIIYSAALGTAAKYWLNLYAVEKKGPVFPPMFSVLSTVFTIILGILLLGESLTLGSLLGTALVFGGLYTYLYGKANEQHAEATPATGMQKETDEELLVPGTTTPQRTALSVTTAQRHTTLLELMVSDTTAPQGTALSATTEQWSQSSEIHLDVQGGA